MQKLLGLAVAISLSTGIQVATLADTYDDFIKTKIAEFQSNYNEKFRCKNRKIATSEDGYKVTYELCLLSGKPISLTVWSDETPIGISSYKNGKLVHIALSEFGDGVGFRNGQPVVEWHGGEYGKRGVNWKITPEAKSSYLADAARLRRILLKFDIR